MRARSLASALVASVVCLASLTLTGSASGTSVVTARAATVVMTLKDPRIVESSGLARSLRGRKRLWTHNDSGGGTTLYAIGRNGSTTRTFELRNARAWDWEGMASARRHGVSYLFVGDIGDNRTQKDSIFVYRAREPRLSAPSGNLPYRSYELVYPDGSHDAETLMVRPGSLRIYVVTKVLDGPGYIYVAPRHPSTRHPNTLRRIAAVPSGLSDGAFLDRHRFVLRTYGVAWLYRTFGARPKEFRMPHGGESITGTRRRGSVLVGSEGRYSQIWRVRLP
jgi:hypothetical protein